MRWFFLHGFPADAWFESRLELFPYRYIRQLSNKEKYWKQWLDPSPSRHLNTEFTTTTFVCVLCCIFIFKCITLFNDIISQHVITKDWELTTTKSNESHLDTKISRGSFVSMSSKKITDDFVVAWMVCAWLDWRGSNYHTATPSTTTTGRLCIICMLM